MVNNTNQNFFQRIDWFLVIIFFVLVVWGWMNIFSTEYLGKFTSIADLSTNSGKQFLFIIISFLVAFFILLTEARFFTTFSVPIYIAILAILIGVLAIGKEVAGSKSWIIISDSFRVQPSEFAKLGVSLMLAKYLSRPFKTLQNNKHLLISIAFIALPMLLILLQKDTGSAIVFVVFFLVFYREGWSTVPYFLAILTIVLFILTLIMDIYVLTGILIFILLWVFWYNRKKFRYTYKYIILFVFSILFIHSEDYIFEKVLRPHQKDRINVLLGKEVDPAGIGYNINQSLIAIGSGGFTGKGFLKGTQTKFNFVPEQSTDFIFCTVGEEWGFLGSLVLIGLFLTLMIRIILLSEKQRSPFSRIYGYCLASVFFFHFIINIGMTINLLPVIGIPLPFFSYGGSSLIAFTCMLFIFIKLNTRKNDLL